MVGVGLVAGVPLGVAIGRTAWSVVAEGIGVRHSASLSVATLAAIVLGSWAAGTALSVVPGIAAARQRAVDALRTE